MPNQGQEESHVRVRMAQVDSICVYQVTEGELEELEKGAPGSTQLNIGIAALSIALSAIVTILTVVIVSVPVLIFFVVMSVVGATTGIIMLVLWYQAYRSSDNIFKRIRQRLKEENAPKVTGEDSITPEI